MKETILVLCLFLLTPLVSAAADTEAVTEVENQESWSEPTPPTEEDLALASHLLRILAAPAVSTRPHDCCWGQGCTASITQSIHADETTSNRCLNTNATYGPQLGYCEEFGYKNPSWISLNCHIAGCQFQGSLKCPLPTGGYSYPSFTMDCPAVQGQLPVAGGGFGQASCLYPGGSGDRSASCSEDGLSVQIVVQY